MKDILNDLNYAIVTDALLEDETNIEILEMAMDNWKELIAQIRREKEADACFIRRHEFDQGMIAEFGLSSAQLEKDSEEDLRIALLDMPNNKDAEFGMKWIG